MNRGDLKNMATITFRIRGKKKQGLGKLNVHEAY